ncbi:integrator complex assembly factor BRAT1 [Pelodytes ibericus]
MDPECSQLLPHVCGVLLDNRQLMNDDSVFEKLLDWFKSLTTKVRADLLLEENQCIIGLLQQVLSAAAIDPSLLAFTMKLTGIFAAHEEGFNYLLNGEIVQDMFGQHSWTNVMWQHVNVRMAWISGLLSMVQHRQAVNFLSESGALQTMLNLQCDRSMFVASAVNDLVAHVFLTSVTLQAEPEPTVLTNLPDVPQIILSRLESSLDTCDTGSQAVRTLAAIFRGCTNRLAVFLWPRVVSKINAHLDHKPACSALYLEEVLLASIRIPAFQDSDCDLWLTVKKALKHLHPPQSASLAAEILKLNHCPPDVSVQAMSVILHPFHYILQVSAIDTGQPGLLEELVFDPDVVERILSAKSSWISLLCQCLSYINELCQGDELKIQIPHKPVLCAVVTLLRLCVGQAVLTSSGGLDLGKTLIGCLKVQKSALDTIRSLSCWPMSKDSLDETHNVLFSYLENPDADATVLKKTLQASLKWLQTSSIPQNSDYWAPSLIFLEALWPVLHKRLCSPIWDHRDTTLEFVGDLVDILKERDGFREVLSSSGMPQVVLDLLKDPEGYVRATAVICLGQLVGVDDLYPTVAEGVAISTGTMKRESIVPNFLDILSEDTEGFPRRAVMKVFTDWLRLGHIQNFHEPEKLLFRILDLTRGDLDWEVKVNALDMAKVFVDQTFVRCEAAACPYTIGLPTNKGTVLVTEAIQTFNKVGLFPFVLDALCDCDRMVALKACEILIFLKSKLGEESSMANSINPELYGIEWLECVLKDLCLKDQHPASNGISASKNWVSDVLNIMDLDSVNSSLSKGSDYTNQTPQALLQDIKITLWGGEEHDADCY